MNCMHHAKIRLKILVIERQSVMNAEIFQSLNFTAPLCNYCRHAPEFFAILREKRASG